MSMRRLTRRVLPALLLASLLTPRPTPTKFSPGLARAEEGIRAERVQFAPGTSGATLDGSITGYETVDYRLGAREGQRMRVGLTTRHPQTYFNILPPGSTGEAIFIGSTLGQAFDGILDRDGDWTVRVYMMRAAARRGETAAYRLEMVITAGP